MNVFSFSGKGRRENNEDYILSRQLLPDCSIHLLADGMGGYRHGEIAALLACETIAYYLQANLEKYNTQSLLKQSVAMANEAILEKRKELGIKMGTTIAGALIEGSKAFLFWLGDVRIYHFRNNELLFKSEDHSLISEMKKRGHVSIKDIERYGNIVTRSINGEPFEEELDLKSIDLLIGDFMVICSDGFWRNIDIQVIYKLPFDEIKSFIDVNSGYFDDNYSVLRIITTKNT